MIAIGDLLYCPHCGIKLFSFNQGSFIKCPHVVFAYYWGDPDLFLAVRASYAKAFLQALMESASYAEYLSEHEIDPITEDEKKAFCDADFSTEDNLARLVAEHCSDLPENLFPELLSQSTIIFASDGYYSGLHIAVDNL